MRRIFFSIAALGLVSALFTFVAPTAQAGPGPCGSGETEIRGRVTDAATGQPLTEVTSVEVSTGTGPYDGFGTEPDSRYSFCVPAGTYYVKYVADDYRAEWWNDQPNFASATGLVATGSGSLVANAALTPKGRVIAGRVTNVNGVPKFASVNIWRLIGGHWTNIDGIANDAGNSWYEFVVPGTGRYRVHADVDHHKSRFATSATHLSAGRIINVGVGTTFINDVHVRVPYCPGPSDDFCIPAGFYS